MFIEKNVVYTNFTGTRRVKVAAIFIDEEDHGLKKVRAFDLRPPGGTVVFLVVDFEKEFTKEVALSNNVAEPPRRPKNAKPQQSAWDKYGR